MKFKNENSKALDPNHWLAEKWPLAHQPKITGRRDAFASLRGSLGVFLGILKVREELI